MLPKLPAVPEAAAACVPGVPGHEHRILRAAQSRGASARPGAIKAEATFPRRPGVLRALRDCGRVRAGATRSERVTECE